MDLFDLPLTAYFLILFGLLALTILIRGFSMPQNHAENQKARSLIRKKLFLKNDEEDSVNGKSDSDQLN